MVKAMVKTMVKAMVKAYIYGSWARRRREERTFAALALPVLYSVNLLLLFLGRFQSYAGFRFVVCVLVDRSTSNTTFPYPIFMSFMTK